MSVTSTGCASRGPDVLAAVAECRTQTRPHTSHAVYFSHFLSILQLSVRLTTRPCSCGQSITPHSPPLFSLSAHSCRPTTVLGGTPPPGPPVQRRRAARFVTCGKRAPSRIRSARVRQWFWQSALARGPGRCWGLHIVSIRSALHYCSLKKLMLLFSKDALNWSKATVKTFIMSQKVSFLD